MDWTFYPALPYTGMMPAASSRYACAAVSNGPSSMTVKSPEPTPALVRHGRLAGRAPLSWTWAARHTRGMTAVGIDDLTGVLGLGEQRRMRTGSAVAIVDLLHFRDRINEPFGHVVGDQVLREMGTRLRGGLAPHRVDRHAGDEFGRVPDRDSPADSGLGLWLPATARLLRRPASGAYGTRLDRAVPERAARRPQIDRFAPVGPPALVGRPGCTAEHDAVSARSVSPGWRPRRTSRYRRN
jgi:Diguanylate cyclase, GGDEF domain